MIAQLDSQFPWELVIVNNGSGDGTADLLQEFLETSTLNVTIVNETTPGLANTRNAGVLAATGRVLAFTDDDCLPATDFIVQMLNVFN